MPRQTLYASPHPQLEPWPPLSSNRLLSDEPAREVYLASCAQIAKALAPLGFKYTKSKQTCHRTCAGYGNEIRFQSSHFNAAGYRVRLWMHANVSSDTLRSWRGERLPVELVTDRLAGGMVHLLGTNFATVQWELADPLDRESTVADAVTFIRSEVIPYFEQFEQPETLIARLLEREIPGLDLYASVEFSFCFGDKELAQRVLNRFIRDNQYLREGIIEAKARALDSDFVNPNGYAERVLSLCRQYDLVCGG